METASSTEAIEALNHLIEICKDGEYGYNTVAEHTEDPTLKAEFIRFAGERQQYTSELKGIVASLGGDPENTGDTMGAFHRAWIDIKSAFSGKENKALLEECVKGEKAAVGAYGDALQNESLSADIKATLTTQLAGITAALALVNGQAHVVNS